MVCFSFELELEKNENKTKRDPGLAHLKKEKNRLLCPSFPNVLALPSILISKQAYKFDFFRLKANLI